MAKPTKPSAAQIEALNARAAEYGYGVDADGRIILSSGRMSSCSVTVTGKHIIVGARRPGRGDRLWDRLFTGSDIGVFLEKFWFARPKSAGEPGGGPTDGAN